MSDLTDDALREIVRLAENAAPAPWDMCGYVDQGDGRHVKDGQRPRLECIRVSTPVVAGEGGASTLTNKQRDATARLIAALGTHGKAVVEELLRARELLERANDDYAPDLDRRDREAIRAFLARGKGEPHA